MPNTTPMSLLVSVAALFVAGCNADRISSTALTPTARVSASVEPPQQGLQTAYSRTFTRSKGPPTYYTETLDLSQFEGQFLLRVTNGDGSGTNLVRAGSVSLDDVTLLSNTDLEQAANTSWVFSFDNAPSALSLTLMGKPGSSIRFEIEGHPRRWRVCPGETYYRTYPTVQDAVSAADAGATIWVCDGVHYAAAVVNKPLTIRPEHSGAAILRDTLPWSPSEASPNAGGPAPIFWIQRVMDGTFRVVDFDVILRQSAVVVTDSHTRVELDSLRRTSVDSAHTTAVRAFAGSGSSQVEFTRSSVAGLWSTVLAAGGVVNLSDIAVSRVGQGVLYTNKVATPLDGGAGSVVNSTFTSCGDQRGCISSQSRGGVTISGNTFTKPAGTQSGTAIQVQPVQNQNGVAQLPIVIDGNVFIGNPSATPNLIPTWTMASAVQVLTVNPAVPSSSITMTGNHITDAATMISINSANGTSIDAHDNTVAGSYEAVRVNNQQVGGVPASNVYLTFRRNDVTSSVRYFGAFGSNAGVLDLKCNWWGSAAGPVNPEWLGSSSVYTPWATQPIAGHSEISCP